MDLKAQQRSALARHHGDYLLRCYARAATNFEAGLARAVFVRPGLMLSETTQALDVPAIRAGSSAPERLSYREEGCNVRWNADRAARRFRLPGLGSAASYTCLRRSAR